jgi:hypothetical protein
MYLGYWRRRHCPAAACLQGCLVIYRDVSVMYQMISGAGFGCLLGGGGLVLVIPVYNLKQLFLHECFEK